MITMIKNNFFIMTELFDRTDLYQKKKDIFISNYLLQLVCMDYDTMHAAV